MQLKPDEAAKLAGELLDLETHHGTDPESGLVGVPPSGVMSLPGGRLGSYRISRLVGTGGMGEVYEAEQDNPRRRVALKVVRTHMLSDELRRRFEHEVRILGSLQHPGIAQIYEAGQFETSSVEGAASGGGASASTPFFAMEYVEGEPLTAYAASRKLGVRERLELFLRVCQAVEHAHQRGIIHRDLKPANILVSASAASAADSKSGSTLSDQLGQPKVLDFGVARATDADVSVTTLHTEVGKLVGTLPYMSPEQASGNPDELDTRSDVYALGVVLYELLSGKLPYEVKGDGGARVAQALRVIKEVDPTPLSSIDRMFRGDLETIVGKALEKERERRYQSVGELAGDVRRYLDDEPIVARRASGWYELRKLARRNKGIVVGVVVASVGLAGAAAVAVGYAVAASRARDEARYAARIAGEQTQLADERGRLAELQRQQAEREAGVARAVNDFVIQMLSSVDPRSMGRDVTIAALLDRAPDQVARTLGRTPGTAGEILMTVARMYAELGNYQRAVEVASEATTQVEHALGVDDPMTMRVASERGNILAKSGQAGVAIALLREVLDKQSRILGANNYDTLSTAGSLVGALMDQGLNQEADALSVDTISRLERVVGKGDGKTKQLKMFRAMALDRLERWVEAEDAFRSLINQLDPDSERVEMLAVKENLAHVLRCLERYKEAEDLLGEIVQPIIDVYGKGHPHALAVLNNLAIVRYKSGNKEGAVASFAQLVEAMRASLGPDHPDLATTIGSYAQVLRETGQIEHAIKVYQEAIDIDMRSVGRAHLDTLSNMRGLCDTLLLADEPEAALAVQDQMVQYAAELPEESEFWTAAFGVDRGQTLTLLGRYDDADKQLLGSLAILERIEGSGSPKLYKVTSALAALYDKADRHKDADQVRARYPQSVPPRR